MAEFLMLPEAFVRYVAERKQIPVPTDTSMEALQALIETVYLEASMDIEMKRESEPAQPQPTA